MPRHKPQSSGLGSRRVLAFPWEAKARLVTCDQAGDQQKVKLISVEELAALDSEADGIKGHGEQDPQALATTWTRGPADLRCSVQVRDRVHSDGPGGPWVFNLPEILSSRLKSDHHKACRTDSSGTREAWAWSEGQGRGTLLLCDRDTGDLPSLTHLCIPSRMNNSDSARGPSNLPS